MRHRYFVYFRPSRHAPWQEYALESNQPITEYVTFGRGIVMSWIKNDSIYRWVCDEIKQIYPVSCVARWAQRMPTVQEMREWSKWTGLA